MTSFWRLYSICLTLVVLLIQLMQWQFPSFPAEVVSTVQRVISVPPKPKGVQEITQGSGDEVVYTEAGCLAQPDQFHLQLCLGMQFPKSRCR